MTDLLIIKPEDVQKGSVYRFSDQIINTLRKVEELFVVGTGIAISLTATAVSRAASIANVNIGEVTLDYIGAPKLGIGGIFFVLNKEPRIDWEAKKNDLEKTLNLSFDRGGQLLIISNNLPNDRAIPLALSRVAETGSLKISAAGTAINREVPIALELVKGGLAKEELGIELVFVTTKPHKLDDTGTVRPETIMEIFISKGKKHLSRKHEQILKMLTSG